MGEGREWIIGFLAGWLMGVDFDVDLFIVDLDEDEWRRFVWVEEEEVEEVG